MFNPYIIVPLVTWVVAQLAKFTIQAFKGNLNFRLLYATGGMPSVHSAVVTALAVTSGLVDGGNSHLFGLSLILAVIVIYDSLNVRRSTGDQAVALNLLIDSLNAGRPGQAGTQAKLREVLGHTPGEVIAGVILGVVLGGLFNYTHLTGLGNFLSAQAPKPETFTYLGIAAGMVVVAVALAVALRRRARQIRAWKRLLQNVLAISIFALALEGLFSFGSLENASFLIWRAWGLVTIVLAAALMIWAAAAFGRRVPREAAALADAERKAKWLKPAKKRKRR